MLISASIVFHIITRKKHEMLMIYCGSDSIQKSCFSKLDQNMSGIINKIANKRKKSNENFN